MVPLAGRPLLRWQLAALRDAGVSNLAIVRGYCADQLKNTGCVTFDNPRWESTNMVSTLRCADAWLSGDDTVVAYADIVYHPDIIRSLRSTPGDIVVAYDRWWDRLWSARFEDPLSDAETFRCAPDGALLEIGGRATSRDQIQGQYMGLLKFSPAGWERIRKHLDALSDAERDRLDMTSLLRQLLASGVRIHTSPVEGRWCEADHETDLEVYERQLSSPDRWTHDWRWPEAA